MSGLSMAESKLANDGLDVSAIGDHLRQLGMDFSGPLTARLIAGGRSNLTYVMSDTEQSWVVRRPPAAGLTSSAHDMAREFRVTQALAKTEVPVPRPIALCEETAVIGAPFTVVEFVQGRTIRTQKDLSHLDDEQVAGCVENLVHSFAALHAVDHVEVGLGEFGRPDGYAARQLRRWSSQWSEVSHESDGQSEQLAAALGEQIPDQSYTSVVHGDFRIDNTLLGDENPVLIKAIVDWELSTIGDPVADVALMCAYRHPALDLILGAKAAWTSDRLPGVEELAAMYEAHGAVRLEHWEFHLALAYYKVAVIAQGIEHRFQAGATVGDGFDTAGLAVAELLAAGHDAIAAR